MQNPKEIKWHDACKEAPKKSGWYIIVRPAINVEQVYFDVRNEWPDTASPIQFWSEIPSKPSSEELDEEAWLEYINTDGTPSHKVSFLAGRKSGMTHSDRH